MQIHKKLEATTGHRTLFIRPNKGAASYVAREVTASIEQGQRVFKIRVPEGQANFYPNHCVPIAGVIDHFKESESCDFLPSKSLDRKYYAGRLGLLNPYTTENIHANTSFLDKIWQFNEEDQYQVVEGIIGSLRGAEHFEAGVLNAVELCLNEIMDNVLTHASSSKEKPVKGFVMAQVHHRSRAIAIAVFDNGIGIPASLGEISPAETTPKELIRLALSRGITDGKGAGNGLWMLDRTIQQNQGIFEIASGGFLYSLKHKEKDSQPTPVTTFSKVYSYTGGTTLVDFQLDGSQPLDLEKIMGPSGFTDFWKEAHENEDRENELRLYVKEEAQGLGSRHDAKSFRILVENALESVAGKVVLDFKEIEIISLSFADEAIRKLAVDLGTDEFNNRIELTNLNAVCEQVIGSVFEGALQT